MSEQDIDWEDSMGGETDPLEYFKSEEEKYREGPTVPEFEGKKINGEINTFLKNLYGNLGVDSIFVSVTSTTECGGHTATFFKGVGNRLSQQGAVKNWLDQELS